MAASRPSHATRESSEPRRPHVINVTSGCCLNKDVAWKQEEVGGTGWARREASILIKCYTGSRSRALIQVGSLQRSHLGTNKMTTSFSNYHPQPSSARAIRGRKMTDVCKKRHFCRVSASTAALLSFYVRVHKLPD